MKNLSTGSGLAILGGAIVIHALIGATSPSMADAAPQQATKRKTNTPPPAPNTPTTFVQSTRTSTTPLQVVGLAVTDDGRGVTLIYRMWSDGGVDWKVRASDGTPTPWFVIP